MVELGKIRAEFCEFHGEMSGGAFAGNCIVRVDSVPDADVPLTVSSVSEFRMAVDCFGCTVD